MTDNGFVSADTRDDSPWRPGADVRFDHPPIRPFDDSAPERAPADHARVGPLEPTGFAVPPPRPGDASAHRRTPALAAVAVLILVGVSVVLVMSVGGDAPAGSADVSPAGVADEATGVRTAMEVDLGGDVTLGAGDVPLLSSSQCPAERLPESIAPLWNIELADVRQIVSPVTIGEESVVAVVGFDDGTANGLGSVAVVGLNLDDGRERWRAALQPATGRHEIIGVAAGAVIVRSAAGPDMAYRRLFAFDEGSGAILWDRGFRGDWSATMQSATGLVYVGVRRPAAPTTDESEVEVLDPRTGDRLHVAAGAFVGLDPDGRLVTRIGDKVMATSIEDRELLGVVEPADAPFALVGTRVVVADRDETGLDVYAGDGAAQAFPLVGSAGLDAPGWVVALDSIGASALLVLGNGFVHGAQVGDDTVELRWRVDGVVLENVPTDRGRSLLVATEGGAQQRVVDSSTGRTIVQLEMRPGTFATLSLVANGVVVQDHVDGEPVRVALDLDGRERWALPGSGPFAVGRGVVVDVDDSDAVVRVTALGDPPGERNQVGGCRSVMTEWIPR